MSQCRIPAAERFLMPMAAVERPSIAAVVEEAMFLTPAEVEAVAAEIVVVVAAEAAVAVVAAKPADSADCRE